VTSLSIIVPTLDEAGIIVEALVALAPMRAHGGEVIVADGGSADATVNLARPLADQVIVTPPGRAVQMNAGARCARGGTLLFLHADTRLPEGAVALVLDGLDRTAKRWGRFDVTIGAPHPLLRVVEWFMNRRSWLSAIATGDQAMFVRRDLFEASGGFPDIALMEDIALSRLLRRHGRPLCIHERVVTSGRRWMSQGILATIVLMWVLRAAYFMGADPGRLQKAYGGARHRR